MSLVPFVLTIAAAALAFKGPILASLAAVFTAVLLVPDTAFLPGGAFDHLPLYRIVLLAFVAGMVARVIRREASIGILRASPIVAAFAVWLMGAAILGIALAPSGLDTTARYRAFFGFADQALMFVGVLAAARLVGNAEAVARVLITVFAVSVAIAAAEQVFDWSFGRSVLTFPGLRQSVLGAQDLELRDSTARVRAAAQFSLGYAWTSAIILPLVTATIAHLRSRLLWVLPAIAGATIIWTRSRSALPALGIGLVLVVALSGFRKHLVLLLIVAALGATSMYLSQPSLREPFTSQSAQDSDRSRQDRQTAALSHAADRPVIGLGLGALNAQHRIYGVDFEFLYVFAELGAIGLALFCFLLAVALLACGRGLRAPPGPQRTLAAATTTAAALAVAAGVSYDFFNIPGSALPFWAVVAIGVSNGEAVGAAATQRLDERRSRLAWFGPGARLALPIACLVVGVVLARSQPTTAELSASFETLPVYLTATTYTDFAHTGTIISEAACELAEALRTQSSSIRCWPIDGSGGLGEITWRGPSAAAVQADAFASATTIRRSFPGFRPHALTLVPVVNKPIWATTAPWWLTLTGIGASLFIPWRRRSLSVTGTARGA